MIVKFFRHGNTQKGKSGRTGGGNSVRDYLLGKDKQRENATLIRGNADQTTEVINNITNKSIYTSGVLSFSKDEKPTDEQIEKIIDSYENTLFPNMDKDQYSSYWVRHEDKDRTELHFVFANIELKTGKALPVYYHRNDKNLVDSWKNLVNDKYGFIDPNAPMNRKQLTPTTRNDKDNAQKDSIHERILSLVERNRSINSRDDVVKAIENLGYEVTRTSKKDDSISIKNPQGGRNLKLKGELYSPNFSRDKLPDHQLHAQIYYDKDRDSRINEQRAKYEHNLSLREKRLNKRFGEIDRTPTEPKLTQALARIRAENEPIFLENIARAEKQAKEQVIIAKQVTQLYDINQSDREILPDETYHEWKKLIPERLEEKRNNHVAITNSIYGKAQNQILEPSEFEQFKKSLDSIYTIDNITTKREQAKIAQQQAELEQRTEQQRIKQAIEQQQSQLAQLRQPTALTDKTKQTINMLSDSRLDGLISDFTDKTATIERLSKNQLLTNDQKAEYQAKQSVLNYAKSLKVERERPVALSPKPIEQPKPMVQPTALNELRSDERQRPEHTVKQPQKPPKPQLNQYQQVAYNIAIKHGVINDTDEKRAEFALLSKEELLRFENPYQDKHDKYASLVRELVKLQRDKQVEKIQKQIDNLIYPPRPKKGTFERQASYTKRLNSYFENELRTYNNEVRAKRIEQSNVSGQLTQAHYKAIAERYPDLAEANQKHNEFELFKAEVNKAITDLDRQQAPTKSKDMER